MRGIRIFQSWELVRGLPVWEIWEAEGESITVPGRNRRTGEEIQYKAVPTKGKIRRGLWRPKKMV